MAKLDMRVRLRLADADTIAENEAAFREGEHFVPAQAHPPGCACCAARNPAGVALASLLQDRARGRGAFFQGGAAVTRTAAGREMLLEALRTDPVASACFRLDD